MNEQAEKQSGEKVAAGLLAPWDVGEMPVPPMSGWRMWLALIGPGVVLAGTSIGTGEWLFGPAVSAQYGATLLWLALTSIIMQVFCNIMAMRYAIYCGEPMIVGALRTRPGPAFWIMVIIVLDFGAIWPYNASNAAVPLASAILGRLPQTPSDFALVKALGFAIFLAALVPLVFGGTVYRMLEKIMTFKLVVVLGYCTIVAVFLVSPGVAWDVVKGFFRFGTVPLRPDVLIVDRHFNLQETNGGVRLHLKGSWERDGSITGSLVATDAEGKKTEGKLQLQTEKSVNRETVDAAGVKKEPKLAKLDGFSPETLTLANQWLVQSKPFVGSKRFLLRTSDQGVTLSAEGTVENHHTWVADRLAVEDSAGEQPYSSLGQVPEPHRGRLKQYLEEEGLEYVSLIGYTSERGKLPPLDWATIVAFIAIAGAGGLTNSMFSNYARDKGWGMGYHVGAIPSAFGGLNIGLSHTGSVFRINAESLARWKGWMRHIWRDQTIWLVASVIGMALPCMMSLEFIRNSSLTTDRVAAMTAEGIADRYPSFSGVLWFMTLLCGFLVLAPGQVSASDQISRRWTDIIWTISPRMQALGPRRVKHVYYSILAIYCVCGLTILWLVPPYLTATISSVLQNFALGASALISFYMNRTLMPREVQPNWLMQIGSVVCGVFFIGISAAVLWMWASRLW